MKRVAAVACVAMIVLVGTVRAGAAPPDASASSGCNVVRLLDAARATGQTWHFDCGGRYSGQGSFVVTIFDTDADADGGPAHDTDNQGIQQIGINSGAGTEHYHSGGNTKFLQIMSLCAWDVVITRA